MSLWDVDRDDEGRATYYSYADVAVSLTREGELYSNYAQVKAYSYPDGSVMNQLDADDLRDLATMFEEAANELDADE